MMTQEHQPCRASEISGLACAGQPGQCALEGKCLDVLISTYPILRYFRADHLRPPLQNVSTQFKELAWDMAGKDITGPPEMAAALRKLKEAKDCAVCAVLELD